MITPIIKDRILNKLISTGFSVKLNIKEEAMEFEIHPQELLIILEQFEEYGLIKLTKFLGGEMLIKFKAEAFDLNNHGGFVAQEELLTKNIEKLLLELERLKPSMPDRIEKITSIISAITSALSLFK